MDITGVTMLLGPLWRDYQSEVVARLLRLHLGFRMGMAATGPAYHWGHLVKHARLDKHARPDISSTPPPMLKF